MIVRCPLSVKDTMFLSYTCGPWEISFLWWNTTWRQKVQWSQVVSRQLSLAITYVYSECVPQCLSTDEHVFQCVWVCVCAWRGHSHVCLERVLSLSWNVPQPPMLRWLPSSKMAARITPSQWATQRSKRFSERSSLLFLCSFFPSFLLLSVSPLSLCG